MNIFFIGGSPCSGKSSIAEILSQNLNFYYFKVDEYLDKYIKLGAQKGYSICKKHPEMTAEQIWMRDPIIQMITFDTLVQLVGAHFELKV